MALYLFRRTYPHTTRMWAPIWGSEEPERYDWLKDNIGYRKTNWDIIELYHSNTGIWQAHVGFKDAKDLLAFKIKFCDK